MQGIWTKTYGPHRIKATCHAKTIVVDKDSTLSDREQHRAAALKLATELGWIGWWYAVTLPGIKGLVWAPDQEKQDENKFYVHRTDPAKEAPR